LLQLTNRLGEISLHVNIKKMNKKPSEVLRHLLSNDKAMSLFKRKYGVNVFDFLDNIIDTSNATLLARSDELLEVSSDEETERVSTQIKAVVIKKGNFYININ
jgi:hypothetical protein